MTRNIAVAMIGAITACPVIWAGAASASVEGFLLEMDTPFATHDEQLAEGNAFCAALTKGSAQKLSGPAAAAIITNMSSYYANQWRAGNYGVRLMVTAVKELCPANKSFFMVAAQAYDAQNGE